jgi:hypothetical protein
VALNYNTNPNLIWTQITRAMKAEFIVEITIIILLKGTPLQSNFKLVHVARENSPEKTK